jgi:putative flippase GtrA
MTGDHIRLLRFLAVGLINTAFGYAAFALLVTIGFDDQLALALAFALGVLWNYCTHARLVFDTKGRGRMVPYGFAYAGIYALNAMALKGATTAGLTALVAQALLVLPMAALSFVLISLVLTGRIPFQTPAAKQPPEEVRHE